MAQDNVKSIIEALLFASDKPLTIEQARKVLGHLEAPEARKILEDLKAEYEQSNRGMRITEIAGGFQMITAPSFAGFLRKLFKARHVERLSKPALETLAIIAYKQPVTKMEVESFRNVNIDGVISSLLERSLVRICGRKKSPGRPYVFGTTRQFLEYFGLKTLEELPKMEEFSNLAAKNDIEEIEESHGQEGENETAQRSLDEPEGTA